jgi:hypothetical protein
MVDPSPTYFRSPLAAARIAADHPDARFVIALRHPIERAFSHYWHDKKKKEFTYTFEQALHRPHLFAPYIETGFYAEHFERWFQHFPQERFHLVLQEDVKADAPGALRGLYGFLGADQTFSPTVLNRRVNVAGSERTAADDVARAAKRNPVVRWVGAPLVRGWRALGLKRAAAPAAGTEYEAGVPPAVAAELCEIYRPSVEKLERMWGLDLANWKLPPTSTGA